MNIFLLPLSGADVVSGESWQLVLLFMMKVMVWYFVTNTHKVMIALILVMFIFWSGGMNTMLTFKVLLLGVVSCQCQRDVLLAVSAQSDRDVLLSVSVQVCPVCSAEVTFSPTTC